MCHVGKGKLCALVTTLLLVPIIAVASPSADQEDTGLINGHVKCSVVQLEHADAESVARAVRSLFQAKDEVNKITWLKFGNRVVLRATPEEVEQMEYLITRLDVPIEEEEIPQATPKQLITIVVEHGDAAELADVADRILRPQTRRGRVSSPRFAVDERTNVIVVHGSDEEIKRTVELIAELDVPVKEPTPRQKDQ